MVFRAEHLPLCCPFYYYSCRRFKPGKQQRVHQMRFCQQAFPNVSSPRLPSLVAIIISFLWNAQPLRGDLHKHKLLCERIAWFFVNKRSRQWGISRRPEKEKKKRGKIWIQIVCIYSNLNPHEVVEMGLFFTTFGDFLALRSGGYNCSCCNLVAEENISRSGL